MFEYQSYPVREKEEERCHAMKWAKFSAALTKKEQFRDRRSKVGIRPDGTRFLKLAGFDMSLQRERVFERDTNKCANCGGYEFSGFLELDHILSRGKGGDDSMNNLQLLGGRFSKCKCHLHKHVRVLSGKNV
jgi:hypothetical protein